MKWILIAIVITMALIYYTMLLESFGKMIKEMNNYTYTQSDMR